MFTNIRRTSTRFFGLKRLTKTTLDEIELFWKKCQQPREKNSLMQVL